jgi:hypothetical protein
MWRSGMDDVMQDGAHARQLLWVGWFARRSLGVARLWLGVVEKRIEFALQIVNSEEVVDDLDAEAQ